MTQTSEHDQQRSEFIRALVQQSVVSTAISDRYKGNPPRTIVQYWHNLRELPGDVEECIVTWARWTTSGFTHCLFDAPSAKAFIKSSLDVRHEYAFERCYHPAMQADYFRLCYLFVKGGFYVDADDICIGTDIECLFDDGRVRVQPLCYDTASETMVSPSTFLQGDAYNPSWIFYVNNNPLIASPRHEIIERALRRATDLLVVTDEEALPEIQSTTGPGNLSMSIFEHGTSVAEVERDLVIVREWDSLAVSKWPLSHRYDARNWRLSNQKQFDRDDE